LTICARRLTLLEIDLGGQPRNIRGDGCNSSNKVFFKKDMKRGGGSHFHDNKGCMCFTRIDIKNSDVDIIAISFILVMDKTKTSHSIGGDQNIYE